MHFSIYWRAIVSAYSVPIRGARMPQLHSGGGSDSGLPKGTGFVKYTRRSGMIIQPALPSKWTITDY